MRGKLNLPQLRKDHSIQSPAQRGDWSSPPDLKLDDLARGLAVEAAAMRLREIKSVPHTWGHVIVFESALLNKRHPAHEDAKGQWRALLAMLALRNRPGFEVRADAVSLDSAAGETGDAHAFAQVVGREKLEPRIESGSTWDTVHLLYAQLATPPDSQSPVLVGVLSPSTIVAPARDFAGEERLGQFWARHGLRDPLACKDELSPDELEVCRLFATKLQGAIPDRTDLRHADAANKLAELLESFATELQTRGAEHHIASWAEKGLDDLVPFNPGGLYHAVNSVWVDDGSAAAVTDLALGKISLDEETAVKLVLADRRCAGTLKRRPEHVSLFGQRTLADLPEPSDDGAPAPIPDHLQAEAASNGILLLGPNDLLPDCLTTLKQFDTAAHPEPFRAKLLPVKPAALLLFRSLEELAERLDLLGSASHPRVGLRVSLTDRKHGRHEHSVSRLYGEGASGALESAYAPSALAAWPDFRTASPDGDDDRGPGTWKWNYLYTSTNLPRSRLGRSVIVTTGLSRRILLRDLRQTDLGSGAAYVERCRERLGAWSSEQGPWNGAGGAVKDNGDAWFEWLRMHSEGGQNPREKSLQRSDTAFDAALFRLPSGDGSVYAGLGILPRARDVQTQDAVAGGTAEIACDFGTSNTILYCKRGEGQAERLPFQPRLRRFNHYRDGGQTSVDKEDEYTAFMPIGTVDQPFATVMQLRSADGVADLAAVWKQAEKPPLWRDYAFFDPDVLHLTESLLSGKGSANLVFDLKWGTEPETRKRMARYLRHITILSLAEVMGHRDLPAPSTVRWHFSYPISMPDADAYQNVIRSESLNERERSDGVEFHTESHAALDYFRGVELAETQAVLVLDIGGGSTDMALETRKNGAVWQHSVQLAGDDLMTEFLLHNRPFLKELDLARVGKGGVFGDKRSQDAFMNPPSDQRPSNTDRNAARAIINSPVFGTAFEKEWLHIKETEAAKRLKAGAAVMMGGLCRFLGRQIEALLRRDSAALAEDDLTTIRLCFGGRGSTLFKRWEKDTAFMGLTVGLTDYASATATDEARRERVAAYFSQDMKHEAAKGMLAGPGGERTPFRFGDGDLRVVAIGARLEQDAKVDATTFLEDLKLGQRGDVAPTVAWEEFASFVKSVGRQCGFGVRIERVAQDAIATDGRQAFSNLLGDSDRVEPPFITMLRTTLRMIYEGKWIVIDWDTSRAERQA